VAERDVKPRVLIIEDDVAMNNMLALNLEKQGFNVSSVTRGREGLKAVYEERPDVVILDIMMPGMDGYQVCERLRDISDVPIIMLTAKVEEKDELKGFSLGADDYVTKPFSLKVLTARIRAALRRTESGSQANDAVYDDGTLRVDLERRQVSRNGESVDLTPTEFRLLACLVRDKGRVVSHEELQEDVWGPGYTDATDCLSVYVRYLRKKLEDDPGEPEYILNRWGTGYWFAPQPHGSSSENLAKVGQ
jgi:two-component system KDP operon response regulator KdpE